jgi:hypothetical protein
VLSRHLCRHAPHVQPVAHRARFPPTLSASSPPARSPGERPLSLRASSLTHQALAPSASLKLISLPLQRRSSFVGVRTLDLRDVSHELTAEALTELLTSSTSLVRASRGGNEHASGSQGKHACPGGATATPVTPHREGGPGISSNQAIPASRAGAWPGGAAHARQPGDRRGVDSGAGLLLRPHVTNHTQPRGVRAPATPFVWHTTSSLQCWVLEVARRGTEAPPRACSGYTHGQAALVTTL